MREIRRWQYGRRDLLALEGGRIDEVLFDDLLQVFQGVAKVGGSIAGTTMEHYLEHTNARREESKSRRRT